MLESGRNSASYICDNLRQVNLSSHSAASLKCMRSADLQYVCRHLEQAATWCLVKEVCREEAESVEDCVGGRSKYGPPSSVPERCKKAMRALDACMEAHAQP